jgi:uncharacterized membrane protein
MFRDRNPQHWKLGFIYYNPDQPRLFVAKRSGTPITLNFAKPMAWVVAAIVPAIAVLGFIIDKVHPVR